MSRVNRALRVRIEEHWADRLECAPRFLREPGVHFAPAVRPGSLYIVGVDRSTVVCADESWEAPLLALRPAERLIDRVALASVLEEGTRIVGPAFIGYAERLDAVLPSPERLPGAGDAAFAALRAASSPEEWEHAGLEEHEEPLFAAMHEGVAVAAAGFVRVLEEVAHIGVLCHPAHRNRGLGRQVVAAAAHRALALGLLAQYQTLWSNAGALGDRAGAWLRALCDDDVGAAYVARASLEFTARRTPARTGEPLRSLFLTCTGHGRRAVMGDVV